MDKLIDPVAHDMLSATTANAYIERIRGGEFAVVTLVPPCSTYSVLRDPALRTKADPLGLRNMGGRYGGSLRDANQLAEFTARVIRAAHDARVPWALENPASVSNPRTKWYWESKAHHAALWDVPIIRQALRDTGALTRTLTHCAYGAPWRKWTSFAFGGPMRDHTSALDYRICTHAKGSHLRLNSYNEHGVQYAAIAAAYPAGLCRELAEAARRSVPATIGAARAAPQGPTRPQVDASDASGGTGGRQTDGNLVCGGRISDGPTLSASLAERVGQARAKGAPFISARNLIKEADDLILKAAIPAGITAYHPTAAGADGPPRKKRVKGAPLPAPAPLGGAEGSAERPKGNIAIEGLYLPGIYASEVQGWLDKAASALTALLRGDKVPTVPTLVLTEDHMAPWARGSVWDCSDRLKCEPVQRSTAATPIAGAKRLDPTAFQKMAADLNWPDADIVRQVGGGGIESNSACEPLTVLAWHHSG